MRTAITKFSSSSYSLHFRLSLSLIFKQKATELEIPKQNLKSFGETFFQVHGTICLGLAAGHAQKRPNIVSVQIPPESLSVCPSFPVESIVILLITNNVSVICFCFVLLKFLRCMTKFSFIKFHLPIHAYMHINNAQ